MFIVSVRRQWSKLRWSINKRSRAHSVPTQTCLLRGIFRTFQRFVYMFVTNCEGKKTPRAVCHVSSINTRTEIIYIIFAGWHNNLFHIFHVSRCFRSVRNAAENINYCWLFAVNSFMCCFFLFFLRSLDAWACKWPIRIWICPCVLCTHRAQQFRLPFCMHRVAAPGGMVFFRVAATRMPNVSRFSETEWIARRAKLIEN